MHPILAEALDGWLFAAAAFFGGLAASLLALVALLPAWRGNRRRTVFLTTPAFVIGLLATVWIGSGFLTDGLKDPDFSMSDFMSPWLAMAGPSLTAGFLALLVLWFRRKTVTPP
jgi:hypothetical protein